MFFYYSKPLLTESCVLFAPVTRGELWNQFPGQKVQEAGVLGQGIIVSSYTQFKVDV